MPCGVPNIVYLSAFLEKHLFTFKSIKCWNHWLFMVEILNFRSLTHPPSRRDSARRPLQAPPDPSASSAASPVPTLEAPRSSLPSCPPRGPWPTAATSARTRPRSSGTRKPLGMTRNSKIILLFVCLTSPQFSTRSLFSGVSCYWRWYSWTTYFIWLLNICK